MRVCVIEIEATREKKLICIVVLCYGLRRYELGQGIGSAAQRVRGGPSTASSIMCLARKMVVQTVSAL